MAATACRCPRQQEQHGIRPRRTAPGTGSSQRRKEGATMSDPRKPGRDAPSQARTADPLGRHPCSQRLLRHRRTPVSRRADHMQPTLWGKNAPQRRRNRKSIQLPPAAPPYSITGSNDCAIIGHTLNAYDLAGYSTCIDCGVRVFCPGCVQSHPQDGHAVPVQCQRHEESAVSA